ncbi:MAG TPA: ATP-dependent Clp protease adaptor ClpS [Candidatus Methylomirabilis sp.]|nr:ATP-dependent Clp protease adaptor ClpS [Candidatus Methylomirabilis sp.]
MPDASLSLPPPLGGDGSKHNARLESKSHRRFLEAVLASSASSQQTAPEEVAELGTGSGEGSKVFLFNCECHTFEEVITQLLKAVPGMTRPLAEELAWRVHTQGLAEVYRGSAAECDRVAKVLGETGLIVQVL